MRRDAQTGLRLQGWAMIAVLTAGFGLGVAALSRPGPRQRLAEVMTLDAFLSGHTAAAVNHAMAHDLPIGGALQAAGGVLRWRLFGSGGPQVTVGCRDWLYLTEELRPWPGSDASMRARAEALHRIVTELQTKGIALQAVLVPDKARIETQNRRDRRELDEILNRPHSKDDPFTVLVYGAQSIGRSPEVGCGVRYSGQSADRFATFARLLDGISVVDLNAVFAVAATPVYYRTDTHWNEAGAALAARTIAAAVTAPVAHDATFRTDAAPVADRAGDLLRLMSLDGVPDLALKLRPLPDREAPETTVRVDAPAEGGGLLDDAPVPEIVLLGSSYSVNANFHGRLQEALGAPIGQFAQAGGGFWGSARDYFRSLAFHETPPKLVIWEIPERVINQPIDAEEAVFLKEPMLGID